MAQASGRHATEGACEGTARLHSTPEPKDFLQAGHLPAQSEPEEGDRDPVATRGHFSCTARNSNRKVGIHNRKGGPGVCAWALSHQCRAQLLRLGTPGIPAWFQICPCTAGVPEEGLPPPTKTDRQRLACAKSPVRDECDGRNEPEIPGTTPGEGFSSLPGTP